MEIDNELISRFNLLSVQDKNKLINGINKDALEVIKKMLPESQSVQKLLELKKLLSN
jgi:hypothetical protein